MMTLPRLRRLVPLLMALPLSAQMAMTPRDSARHVLDRLAWGPSPGQIDAVVREGVKHWIDRQLAFDQANDPAISLLEKQFEVLNLGHGEMYRMDQEQQANQRMLQTMTDTAARQKAIAEQRMMANNGGNGRKGMAQLNNEYMSLSVLRSVESERQLADVLTDFWGNHFNVFVNKGQTRPFVTEYYEQTIRPRVLGRFEDLLVATAKSPAMLTYLDNAQSMAAGGPVPVAGRGRAQQQAQAAGRGGLAGRGMLPGAPAPARRAQGLNENYARELMELHTLGVDGGYTQADVIAVARVLTGWTIDRQGDGDYVFRAQNHDRDQKVVLGQKFPAGRGEDEGMALLKMLANHPSTMHHVSAKLCARFVADVAPDGCIDDAVRAWQKSGGQIREVLRAVIYSPDFWSAANVQSKIKTPRGFVVSAVRALGGTTDATPAAAQQVGRLGQPLFQMATPNGYPETQADWVNSGALLARMNFAVSLASGRAPGISVDLNRVVPLNNDHQALVDNIDEVILGGLMSQNTRNTILREIADQKTPQGARALAVGLAIGGPEFQRR